MTRNYLDKDLANLHDLILKMCELVVKSLNDSIKSLRNQDTKLAEEVINLDDEIDRMEVEIETACTRLIALQQPAAKDLRLITATFKIITELERVADHGVDIAKITKRIYKEKYIKELIDIPRMGEIVTGMLKDSISAYMDEDMDRAREISKRDDIVDALYSQIFRELLVLMMEDTKKIKQSTYFLLISQYIERVADHVTNICESIIYMVSGEHTDLNE
jgi:phosphate transport system protein